MSYRDELAAAQSQLEALKELLAKEIYSELCRHCGERVSPALMPRLLGYWRGHRLTKECYEQPLKFCPSCRKCMETESGDPMKVDE